MDKRNKVILSSVMTLRSALLVFFEFFLNIYLFEILNGDFNFLMGYSSFGAVWGLVVMFLAMKILKIGRAHV